MDATWASIDINHPNILSGLETCMGIREGGGREHDAPVTLDVAIAPAWED
jgi:hypothetical protein